MSAPPSNKESSFKAVRVEVSKLRKSFDGTPVIKGIDFHVERGEVFVIMGPSGSGKSVLLKHIIGLETPDEGDILIEGESIHNPAVMEKYRMAMVFQSGALLSSLSVIENVGLYLREHRLKKNAEIDRIAVEKLEFLGLKDVQGRQPSELSGGMKKRVAIARALVIDPQLILYDEPTSELDPLMSVVIGQEILSLKNRTAVTSIVVTHDRDLAFGVADRIAMVSDGTIRAIGTPDEIRHHPDAMVQKFLNINFKSNSNPPAASNPVEP